MTDAISAMGKAHHTISRFPVFDNKYATGSNTTNCLPTDTIKLINPLPNAWNMEPTTMQYPANIKLKLIVLSAGTPILIMSLDALKSPNNSLGKT